MAKFLYIPNGTYINVDHIIKITRYIITTSQERYFTIKLVGDSEVKVNEFLTDKTINPGWEKVEKYLATYRVILPPTPED